MQIPTFRDV